MQVEIQDISDILSEVTDTQLLELVEELFPDVSLNEMLEDMIINKFYDLPDDAQAELIEDYSKKLNEKEQTNG